MKEEEREERKEGEERKEEEKGGKGKKEEGKRRKERKGEASFSLGRSGPIEPPGAGHAGKWMSRSAASTGVCCSTAMAFGAGARLDEANPRRSSTSEQHPHDAGVRRRRGCAPGVDPRIGDTSVQSRSAWRGATALLRSRSISPTTDERCGMARVPSALRCRGATEPAVDRVARRRARRSASRVEQALTDAGALPIFLSEEESHGFLRSASATAVRGRCLHWFPESTAVRRRQGLSDLSARSISALPKRFWAVPGGPITSRCSRDTAASATSSTTTSRSTKPAWAVRNALAHRRRCAQKSASHRVDTVIERPCHSRAMLRLCARSFRPASPSRFYAAPSWRTRRARRTT